jgi:hypothetical protein
MNSQLDERLRKFVSRVGNLRDAYSFSRVFIFFRVVHRGKRPLLDRLGDGAEFVAFDTFETATSTGRAQHPRSYLDVNRTCRLLGELAELILRPNLRPA